MKLNLHEIHIIIYVLVLHIIIVVDNDHWIIVKLQFWNYSAAKLHDGLI